MPAPISPSSGSTPTPTPALVATEPARRVSESDTRPELQRAPSVPGGADVSNTPPRAAAPVRSRPATPQKDAQPEAADPHGSAVSPQMTSGVSSHPPTTPQTPSREPAQDPAPGAKATAKKDVHGTTSDIELAPMPTTETAVARRRSGASETPSQREQQRLEQELRGRVEVVARVLTYALMMAGDGEPRTKKEKRDKLTARELRAPDVQERLMAVATVLAQELSISATHFNSMNEAVEAATVRYLNSARRSDVAIATLVTGFMKGIGYLIGMTDSNERAVEKMFKDYLDNSHTLGTFVGHYVALYDVPLGVLGAGVAAGLHHVGTDKDLPVSLQEKINPAQDHIDDTRDASVANLSKNSPRLVAPVLQSLIENRGKLGPITRKIADRVDLSGIDGGAGVLASMRVEYRKLNRRYAQRLVLNTPENVRHSVRRIEGKESASVKRVARSLVAEFTAAPLTYLMLMLMVGPFIGRLFGANASIERDMGLGNNNGLPPGKVDLSLVTSKRAGSTFDMLAMTTFLNYWAPVIAQVEARMWQKVGNTAAVKQLTELLRTRGGNEDAPRRNAPTLTQA